jgi:hypothetical protein
VLKAIAVKMQPTASTITSSARIVPKIEALRFLKTVHRARSPM